MKSSTKKPIFQKKRVGRGIANGQPGFALVITVSILVLLALVAVGLLSLSSAVVRTASRDQDNVVAKANARMAMMMAIGQLQKYAGDDRRITMAADQLSGGSDGGDTAATYERRHWTGVYKSWDHTLEARPDPEFLSWLVSSPKPESLNENSPTNAAGTGAQVELVGEGTVGSGTDGRVSVPVLPMKNKSGNMAWWVGDQGLKAMLALAEEKEPEAMAGVRARLQASPTNAVDLATVNGGDQPFDGIDLTDKRLEALTGWNQTAFFSTSPEAPRPLFHDIVTRSSGLLTNVREGGFRKDLSMELERKSGNEPKSTETALYKVNGESGINLQELWSYYNLYKELRSGRGNYTTGDRIPSRTPALTSERSPKACESDDWHYFKQPVITSYQMVFSLESRNEVLDDGRTRGNRVRLVADPVLTFWNPLDVPVIMTPDCFLTVKYWQVPYDLEVEGVSGGKKICPLQASLSGGTVTRKSDGNYLSLEVGNGSRDQLILKPGEVVKFSQSGDKMVKTGTGGVGGGRHTLKGKAGFNYGGGVSLPLRDANGREVVIADGATLTYELKPNGLTCGQTSRSGRSLSGQVQHSRHFSLNHHEFYVGTDRGSDSLGIGGMYLDWDFGNKRLSPNEVRGGTIAGTKNPRERLFANRLRDVFKPITLMDGRPLSSAQLMSNKSPVMMISYNAKTENGSDLGTKSLSRFNPTAFHVDFYNLNQEERDMLPYEVKVEPLVSWKNRSLETSAEGNAYFGGGLDASTGSSQVTTHSVPHEPLTSLAALQHSFANGFNIQKPKYGYATLNAREPLLPQISHAIGNSLAPSVLKPDETQSVIAGNRPLADHSYLANKGLFDDWFFSTIAPHTASTYQNRMNQKAVAEGFLKGEEPLINSRYVPNIGSRDVTDLLAELFRGSLPTDEATYLTASLMKVEGMFNVNSTSVEAWKVMLAGLNNRSIITRDENGALTITPVSDGIPVAGLSAPMDDVFDGRGNANVSEPSQWTGRRVLSEEEIDELARAIVREVRRRGPFLSLADFVNRRITYDDQLARAGAIQAALDSDDVSINDAFRAGDREVTAAVASRFLFPEAEEGPISQNIAGIVKQADILTPIAPVLSARSDSFVIRGYGEATSPTGKVMARAWCEAVVERDSDYVTGEDESDVLPEDLKNPVAEKFGRVFRVVSFRWLSPDEV